MSEPRLVQWVPSNEWKTAFIPPETEDGTQPPLQPRQRGPRTYSHNDGSHEGCASATKSYPKETWSRAKGKGRGETGPGSSSAAAPANAAAQQYLEPGWAGEADEAGTNGTYRVLFTNRAALDSFFGGKWVAKLSWSPELGDTEPSARLNGTASKFAEAVIAQHAKLRLEHHTTFASTSDDEEQEELDQTQRQNEESDLFLRALGTVTNSSAYAHGMEGVRSDILALGEWEAAYPASEPDSDGGFTTRPGQVSEGHAQLWDGVGRGGGRGSIAGAGGSGTPRGRESSSKSDNKSATSSSAGGGTSTQHHKGKERRRSKSRSIRDGMRKLFL